MGQGRASWFEGEGRFAALYAAASSDLLVFFVRRVFDAQVALDLTADSFAEAFLRRHRFRGADESAARSWLFGIARNKLLHHFRDGAVERRAIARVGIEVPVLGEEELRRIEELAAIEPLRRLVRDSLRELSEEHRSALQLRVVDELSYAEVAQHLGVSEQTARARVSRGLRSLGRALDASESALGGAG